MKKGNLRTTIFMFAAAILLITGYNCITAQNLTAGLLYFGLAILCVVFSYVSLKKAKKKDDEENDDKE